jgi:hypothetical protein
LVSARKHEQIEEKKETKSIEKVDEKPSITKKKKNVKFLTEIEEDSDEQSQKSNEGE